MTEIKDIIRKYRKDNNMTQKELADKSNISLRALSNYENGFRIPPLEMRIKISKILGIPLDEFYDYTDIEDLTELKKILVNKTYRTDREKIVSNAILRDIDEIEKNGNMSSIDIIMNNLSFLLNNEVDSIEVLKYYISSKKYDIKKLSDEMLKDIDRKFSEMLELEFFKLNK